MDELERIVRAIVDPDKWVYDGYVCMGCGALVKPDGTGMDEPHMDDCPFGRAVAWVEANPS